MRAILTNFGTTGDIQPFLALAIELKSHGHEPVLGLAPNFESRVRSLGLEFVPIGPDLLKAQNDVISSLVTRCTNSEDLRQLFMPISSALPRMYEELRALCSRADVLISGPTQAAGRMVHETSGIPFVSIQIDHYGGGGRPAFQQASASLVNSFRGQLGLPTLKNPLMTDANSPQLALYAMSRYVAPRPVNWPDHYHLTGYFFLDNENYQPDDALVSFMNDGERPVVFTLGSTSGDAESATDLILEATRHAKCRAIIQQGWAGLGDRKQLATDVHIVGFVPHHWLFPRANCVVHHGGVGSAASVFRAGIPSIFITHGAPVNAKFAEELGCAGPAISRWQLTVDRLTNALCQTRENSAFHRAAAVLGEKIQNEHGTTNARHLIEDLVNRRS